MAKRKGPFNPFIPENPGLSGGLSFEELASRIKPTGQILRESIEPLQSELNRVTGELVTANERAKEAEERARDAERKGRRSFRITIIIAVIAIIVPIIQGIYYDSKSQAKEQQLEKLSSIVEQQGLQIKTLEHEVSKPKKPLHLAKSPSNNSKVVDSKKP